MNMLIYKITNKFDGKLYVGQTQRTVEERFTEHQKADSYIGCAIRKYGAESFTVEVIETCETIEQLNEREIFWIATFNCKYPNGYNLTDGGEGFVGGRHTDESRFKMSSSQKKRYEDPLECQKRSEEQKKRYEDPIEHKKLSVSQKKRYEAPAEHERKSAEQLKRFKEHPVTEETKAKQSDAATRRYENPAEHEKSSEAQRKRYEDPEEHVKTSTSLKKFYRENPNACEEKSEANRRRWAKVRAERQAKLSEIQILLNFE